jgi:hypothetical protein
MDVLDQRDHGRASAAFRMPEPGSRGADRSGKRQIGEAARYPVLLDRSALWRHRLVIPEVESCGDPLLMAALVVCALPLDLGRVSVDVLAFPIKQAEPF